MFHVLTKIFAADSCDLDGGGFLGFPHWYKYLDGISAPSGAVTDSGGNSYVCVPQVDALSDVWLIVAAVFEILLRLAALGAVTFIVYGSAQLIGSHGDPAGSKKARETITNALIGLVISVIAAGTITFIAGRF